MGIRPAPGSRAHRLYPPFVMLISFLLVCGILHLLLGSSFFGSSDYNSYTLQALAWREGRIALGRDYPHLELAIYNGDWYVSFPPVPAIPLYFLTFLFGANTPDALLTKLYALIALFAIYNILVFRRWNRWQAVFAAFMMTLGGSMLPLILDGAVWYQAQTLAFCLTTCSICLMTRNRPTPALLLYALAVGCRPFNACYGPLLMATWYLRQRHLSLRAAVKKLLPGIALGLTVAAVYALYNWVRFGNPLEFGHNYLPEFTRSEHGQFSLTHLLQNARTFLIGLPLSFTNGQWSFSKFGASVFLSNPALLLLLLGYAGMLMRGRARLSSHLTMLTFAAHLFLLLLHRTGGGFQLGARYAVDLVPYVLIYLSRRRSHSLRPWEMVLLSAGFILFFIGSTVIHL